MIFAPNRRSIRVKAAGADLRFICRIDAAVLQVFVYSNRYFKR